MEALRQSLGQVMNSIKSNAQSYFALLEEVTTSQPKPMGTPNNESQLSAIFQEPLSNQVIFGVANSLKEIMNLEGILRSLLIPLRK